MLPVSFTQFVAPINEKKRLTYALFCREFNVNFEDFIFIDECSVEIKNYTLKTWYKFDHSQVKNA